jgi:hypothetical protein
MSGPQDLPLPSPLCPVDLSGFKFMYFSQSQAYQNAAIYYQQVQAFNSNISTLRAGGQTTLSYYQFPTQEKKAQYNTGRFILIQSYPGQQSQFNPVQQF